MNANNGEERIVHEVALVLPKRTRKEEEEDCVEVLVTELKKRGMVVDRDVGLADEFLKVGLSYSCESLYIQFFLLSFHAKVLVSKILINKLA